MTFGLFIPVGDRKNGGLVRIFREFIWKKLCCESLSCALSLSLAYTHTQTHIQDGGAFIATSIVKD